MSDIHCSVCHGVLQHDASGKCPGAKGIGWQTDAPMHTAKPKSPPAQPSDRDAFEEIMCRICPNMTHGQDDFLLQKLPTGYYTSIITQKCWELWGECRSAFQPQGEPVGRVERMHHYVRGKLNKTGQLLPHGTPLYAAPLPPPPEVPK